MSEKKIEYGTPTAGSEVSIYEFSAKYIQERDDCDSGDDLQELSIITQDAGGGVYYVIETQRWSFNDVNELVAVIEDFKNRLNVK